ncbi:MAG TPA: hypothetical protein EYP58_02985 [bacterium (Candidatus Stahlbacteria)]|nr:hypothetical protein [Candidatus Stahlbacteria bacterium]
MRKIKNSALVLTFFKIGAIGFGGGLAMIGILREYLVRKMKLIADGEFCKGLIIGQFLPGPFVTNFVEYYGYLLRGWSGSLISVVSLLAPSFLIVLILSHLYFRFHDLPALKSAFVGTMPVVIGLLIVTGFSMFRSFIKKSTEIVALGLSICLLFLGLDMIVVVLTAGLFSIMVAKLKDNIGHSPVHLLLLFLVFAKIGAVAFGGGYGALPLMENEVVSKYHWLNLKEFTDGVAIGQLTPGPVAITATFVGYRIGGLLGSLVATIAIFLPSYLMLLVICRIMKKFGDRPIISNFVAGTRPAIIAVLCMLILKLIVALAGNHFAYMLIAITMVLYLFRVPIAILILIGLVLGYTFSLG